MSILRIVILVMLVEFARPDDLLDDLNLDADRVVVCGGEQFKCQECSEVRVRCEYLGLTSFTPIQDALPDTTRSVKFTGNSIAVINSSIFSNPMTSLVELDLSYNRIESLAVDSFVNTPVLSALSLDGNRLDLAREDTLRSFALVSDSLERLNLSNALAISLVDKTYTETSIVDTRLHSLFKIVRNLTELRLSNNSLRSFNVDNTIDLVTDSLTDEDLDYEDVICLLPRLQRLHLDRNRLAHVRFEIKCVNQLSEFSLNSLQLQSNRLTNIDMELIKAFKRMKVTHLVYHQGNYLKI